MLQKPVFSISLLLVITLLSRLPFLNAGYGVEEDSWGYVVAAHNTVETGVFEPSRLPGHPVHELVLTFFYPASPFVFNGLSALMSVMAVFFFALICIELHIKHYFWAALAFAFTPVFYISSTYVIDYVWAIAFVLASLFFVLKQKMLPAGILLGLAIGTRITSGAMLMPFAIILWNILPQEKKIKKIALLSALSILVGILTFIPIIRQFGFNFFQYYDQFPYPPITKLFYKATIGVFGLIGIIAIIVLKFIAFSKKNIRTTFNSKNNLEKAILIACISIFILYAVSYARLPQKSGYMMPLVPFGILFFALWLKEKQFFILCFALILSPFLMSINLTDPIRGASHSSFAIKKTISGQELFLDPFSGPIFSDYSKRKLKIQYVDEVIEKAKEMDHKALIIAGWWYNEILVHHYNQTPNDLVAYTFYADEKKT